MEIAEKLAWLGLVLIHLLPAIAVFRPGGLARLYGSKVGALLPLMEHRSLLFMGVLVLCLWSAFDPAPRSAATVSRSILANLDRTKSTASQSSGTGPTPIRNRLSSSDCSWRIMSASPFWPPDDPRARKRSLPSGR